MPKPPQLRPRAGSVSLFLGAPDRAVPPHGGPIRIGLQARPDILIAPGRLAIDRFPLPVFGRQHAPKRAHPYHPAQCFHEKTATRVLTYTYKGMGGLRFCAIVVTGRVKAQLSFEIGNLRILRGQPRLILPALPDTLMFRGIPGPGRRVAHA